MWPFAKSQMERWLNRVPDHLGHKLHIPNENRPAKSQWYSSRFVLMMVKAVLSGHAFGLVETVFNYTVTTCKEFTIL